MSSGGAATVAVGRPTLKANRPRSGWASPDTTRQLTTYVPCSAAPTSTLTLAPLARAGPRSTCRPLGATTRMPRPIGCTRSLNVSRITDGRGAELVSGSEPAEHDPHVVAAEGIGRQARGRRYRGNPVEAVEDHEGGEAEVGRAERVGQEQQREAAEAVVPAEQVAVVPAVRE